MAKKAVKHRGPKSEHTEPKKGSLAWKIRRKRREEGLNVEELGEKIGVSGASISKIETGRTKISDSSMWTVLRIVLELNTDFDDPAIREHLELWTPRLKEVWRIVKHGPHDFGMSELETDKELAEP